MMKVIKVICVFLIQVTALYGGKDVVRYMPLDRDQQATADPKRSLVTAILEDTISQINNNADTPRNNFNGLASHITAINALHHPAAQEINYRIQERFCIPLRPATVLFALVKFHIDYAPPTTIMNSNCLMINTTCGSVVGSTLATVFCDQYTDTACLAGGTACCASSLLCGYIGSSQPDNLVHLIQSLLILKDQSGFPLVDLYTHDPGSLEITCPYKINPPTQYTHPSPAKIAEKQTVSQDAQRKAAWKCIQELVENTAKEQLKRKNSLPSNWKVQVRCKQKQD